jgi:hypothetical protein
MKYKQIKTSASPARFIHAPYQPLCIKRRMSRAWWRGLFLNFDHHNQPRHCALDAQSRVNRLEDKFWMQYQNELA